ncbi:unnamed protein product [Pleuronectes platessa]|uniref:Uncharacterized protein n=1 Tax=Pleuronectes platessa TaxID=8262 RepID=A0A9N7V2M9_PLEPL|nr:unnamed protein product [Pleuronectes platessa]
MDPALCLLYAHAKCDSLLRIKRRVHRPPCGEDVALKPASVRSPPGRCTWSVEKTEQEEEGSVSAGYLSPSANPSAPASGGAVSKPGPDNSEEWMLWCYSP